MILGKLNINGIKGKSLSWFENHLSDGKQYIQVGKQMTSLQVITCGVPLDLDLGYLLFLLYKNLFKAFNIITLKIFADDNFFFTQAKKYKDSGWQN